MTYARSASARARPAIWSTSKIVIDQRAGGGSLLYLPLDKILQSAGTGGAALAPSRPEAAEASPAQMQRSREAFRSRERESR